MPEKVGFGEEPSDRIQGYGAASLLRAERTSAARSRLRACEKKFANGPKKKSEQSLAVVIAEARLEFC